MTFYVIDKVIGLRVERKGLDEVDFGVVAYPGLEVRE